MSRIAAFCQMATLHATQLTAKGRHVKYTEVELKYALDDPDSLKAKLEELGAKPGHWVNATTDTPTCCWTASPDRTWPVQIPKRPLTCEVSVLFRPQTRSPSSR